MKTTLYKKTRIGKIQQWNIWVLEHGNSGSPEVWTEFGQVDGKMQFTNDVVKDGVNAGRSNATTAYQQACLMAERKITKQKEEGYRDTIEEAETQQYINFCDRFPKELCFYKPKNSIDEKKIAKLEKNGKAIYTVKRDGMMHIVRKTSRFGVEIYSRRMDLVTSKYPHLIKAFSSLPDDTVLLGEVVLINSDGTDNFNGVSSICRSDHEKAIERQDELGKVTYYIFDLAFLEGENVLISKNYGERRKILQKMLPQDNYLKVAKIIDLSHAEALKEVQNKNLEGLVVWDADGVMKDKEAFTFNGKAYRPNILWKSKPKYEDDFIVRFDPENGVGEFGNGKNNGKVRSVFIYQIQDNKEVLLGRCGGGLSDEQRDYYTTAEYPRVWRIEYDSIQPKTGALRFPVFNADRTIIGDKFVNECLMSDTIKRARNQEKDSE